MQRSGQDPDAMARVGPATPPVLVAGGHEPGPDGAHPPIADHRTRTLRRLLDRGVSAHTLAILLPEWTPAIRALTSERGC